MFSRNELTLVKWKSIRRRVWFKVLDRVERSIIDLTIKCVDRVRSLKLAKMVVVIVNKLVGAMRNKLGRLMKTIGRSLAQKVSQIAQKWGNKSAVRWANELAFVRYLTVMCINTPATFKT